MDLVKAIEQDYLRDNIPQLSVGDRVKVHLQIREGDRTRIQVFEGNIIGMHGAGLNQTFTVRRISYGVGVERVFAAHSPRIEKIEISHKGKVRRGKLYYLRDRVGKRARVRTKLVTQKNTADVLAAEAQPEVAENATPTDTAAAE